MIKYEKNKTKLYTYYGYNDIKCACSGQKFKNSCKTKLVFQGEWDHE